MKKTLGIATAMFFGATAASQAATLTVVSADCDPTEAATGHAGSGLSCSSDPARTDADAVNLGAGDGDFYSLGLEGGVLFQLDTDFTGPSMVVEVTNGGTNHREAAEVYGSVDGVNFDLLGTVTNQNGGATVGGATSLNFSGVYAFLGFLDISQSYFAGLGGTGSTDGFDLDAFTVTEVSEVPLPAAFPLFIAGALGLGGAARRRRARKA